MSILVITGSARTGSYTRRLGERIVALTPEGVLAPPLTELPYFDQDREATPPATVRELRAQVSAAQAVVLVTPEYNGTISGLLANALDWLSRPADGGASALRGKPVAAVAASPGGVGGVRALVALRTVVGNAGAELLGGGLAVPEVHRRLQDDPSLAEELAPLLAALRRLPAPSLRAA